MRHLVYNICTRVSKSKTTSFYVLTKLCCTESRCFVENQSTRLLITSTHSFTVIFTQDIRLKFDFHNIICANNASFVLYHFQYISRRYAEYNQPFDSHTLDGRQEVQICTIYLKKIAQSSYLTDFTGTVLAHVNALKIPYSLV